MSLSISAVAYQDDQPGGLNRYTGEIVAALTRCRPESLVYTASPSLAGRFPAQARLVRPRSLARSDFTGNSLRLLWHQTALPRRLKREGATICYSPVAEGMLAPACPQVITIHDLLPLRFPEAYPRLRYYFRHVLPRIARASTAVIAVSETTRDEVRRWFGPMEVPVHVIHGAYDAESFSGKTATAELAERVKRKYGLSEYLLAVGETRPYKNTQRMVEAFARLPRSDLHLAIVGKSNKMNPDLLKLPAELGVEQRVCFLGPVSDSDLAVLYRGAAAFVFPSLYEGFGIPPLEAMACGCPVVCSRAASLPEVCGDAAEYVDPLEIDDIAAGIARVLTDASLRRSLREKGRERVREFSYARTAAGIVRVLEGAADDARNGGEAPRRKAASTSAVGALERPSAR